MKACGRCGKEDVVLDSGWLAFFVCAKCLKDCIADLQAGLDAMRRPAATAARHV